MINFKGGKPIVRYAANPMVTNIQLGYRASVHALDHPHLGKDVVSTSRVLTIFSTGEGVKAFETLNTIYVLDGYKIPE